ncbi:MULTISPECIES: hypothetical protein [Stenotrophomonas]|uniref:Secreted protein n=1 Tax=Stenotrophomonas riyadhensis TaxID=2859893 RepID=A0ABT2XAY5_9GAMM|nr:MULTISPECIES: hypothetical protein [Stenotrophomonas]AWT17054.1 hypothetical protein DM611_17385 [Stenotrophomonas maltophilia]MBH1618818.1 hypothetical protein [Stenotrophomonas maltophilia]MCV0323098.1 hypothetical protein [Stenotrophomonas sp. CFS3442]HEL4103557.1 hypothetical protein [Stenotrophomonas maltophilia]HEL4246013.1 hypothetical protein [Stenotrophomonas maltophilia]
MLSALIAVALAAGSPQPTGSQSTSASYADCLLGHIQPGLSDHAVQLVQQACASKYPESFVASMELERRMSAQRRADFEAAQAEAARSANAAATAAQEAADAAAAKAKGMWAK